LCNVTATGTASATATETEAELDMDQWAKTKQAADIIIVLTPWRLGLLGLALFAAGTATELYRRSVLARCIGAIGIVLGLGLIAFGILLHFRPNR